MTAFFELIGSSVQVYAHTFTIDESASFLSLIYRIKNEAQLVQSNLLSNATINNNNNSDSNNNKALAQQHAENAISILNQTWIKEIGERNQRIASSLATALANLKNAAASTTTTLVANDIKDKVTNLDSLLDEALSVRLTKDQINNSTIQALALANIVNKIDRRYADAFGVGYNDEMSKSTMANMKMMEGGERGNESMSNMSMANKTTSTTTAMSNDNNTTANMNMMSNMMKNDQPNSTKAISTANNSNAHNTIFNVSDYQSASGLSKTAQDIYSSILKSKIPSKKLSAIAELKNSLLELKSAIDAKKPYTDVMLTIHTKVHPSIMSAFNLKLA